MKFWPHPALFFSCNKWKKKSAHPVRLLPPIRLIDIYRVNRRIFTCVIELVNSFTNFNTHVKMNLAKKKLRFWGCKSWNCTATGNLYPRSKFQTLILKDPLKPQHNDLSCIILSKNYDPFFILNKLNMIEYANKRHKN